MEDYKDILERFPFKGLPDRIKFMDEHIQLKTGNTVIDGGAFYGDMASYFSMKVGDSGRVYSIEPNLSNLSILIKNLISMHISSCIPIPYALSDSIGFTQFYVSKNWTNVGSINRYFKKLANDETTTRAGIVPTTTVDEIVRLYSIKNVDFIWLNIEAAEVFALRGMENTLKNHNCKICISVHKLNEIVNGKEKTTTDEVKSILESYGYTIEKVELGNIVYGHK